MPDLKEHLLARQEDIVISLHISLLDCDEIEVTDLFPIECFILMSRKHPLASKTQLDPDDLIHEDIYLPEPVKCYSIYQDYFCGYHINRANLIPTSTIDIALLNSIPFFVNLAKAHFSTLQNPSLLSDIPLLH